MICVTCLLTAREGMEAELKAALEDVVPRCAHHEGLLLYRVHQHRDDPRRFCFYEQWASREALDKHAASPEIAKHRTAIAPMIWEKELELWEQLASVPA